MRYGWMTGLLIVAFCSALSAQDSSKTAQDTAAYAGTWAGTWEGGADGGAGELEITIEKTSAGALAGKLKATGGASEHTAALKTLTIDAGTLKARYDYPLGEGGEVALDAAIEGGTATGTWALYPPGQTTALARGTFSITRK